jgi:hypothetical protein
MSTNSYFAVDTVNGLVLIAMFIEDYTEFPVDAFIDHLPAVGINIYS